MGVPPFGSKLLVLGAILEGSIGFAPMCQFSMDLHFFGLTAMLLNPLVFNFFKYCKTRFPSICIKELFIVYDFSLNTASLTMRLWVR